MMKEEYDFSNAIQGKFSRPLEELDIPIYLNKELIQFYSKKASEKHIDLNKLINIILRKEMEIIQEIVTRS